MSNIISPNKDIMLSVASEHDHDMIVKISRALSVLDRVRILKSLLLRPKNLSDLSAELDIPVSSVSRHIDALNEAQLIFVNYQPGPKGHTKYCSQMVMSYTVSLDALRMRESQATEFVMEMPVGLYSHCHIKAPCGMTGKDGNLGAFDDPSMFFLPERVNAECIWFDSGFISYNFPKPSDGRDISEITFSFEICSETVYYNNNWPSDITVSVNDVEITTFTSPGDFGGRRGHYTPEYWPVTSTQFGILKTISVNSEGLFIDKTLVNSHITVSDLKLAVGNAIKLTIGIKEDAVHRGGLNLFGKNFGDYPQSIIMIIK